MSWFKNILSNPRDEFATVIVASASQCTKVVMSVDPQAPPAKALGVLWEFTACFLHFTSRISAKRHGQTATTATALNDIGRQVSVRLNQALSADLSAAEQEQATAQFTKYLGIAEAEYSLCTGIIVEDKPLSTSSVFGLLGHRIMLHMGQNDITYVMRIEDLAVQTIANAEFKALLDKAIS